MDDLALNRALELLDYLRRRTVASQQQTEYANADLAAANADVSGDSGYGWRKPTEREMASLFQVAPVASGGLLEIAGRIPPHLRDMIKWVEEENEKMRYN